MAAFVIAALLLGLAAVAFAVAALWRPAPMLALALALTLLLGAAGLYHLRGTPLALDPANHEPPKTLDDAVAMLQRRVAATPDNVEARLLLARAYMAQEKFDLARQAYEAAIKRLPDDVDVGVEYAEALMRGQPDGRFPPAAVTLLEAAVRRHPDNQRALFFLGMQRLQSGQPAAAAAIWERLLPMLEPATATALRTQINNARAQGALPPLADALETDALLTVTVDIEPALARLAGPGDTLFVFALAGDGRGAPVAARRVTVGQWPVTVTMGDADSPMPNGKLSGQASVLVQARLSKSGQAGAGRGDLESDPVPVTLGGNAPTASLQLKRALP